MISGSNNMRQDDSEQFAKLLLHDGQVNEQDWFTAKDIQRTQGGRLLEILMGLCPISEESLYQSISRQLNLPFWSEHELSSLQLDPDLLFRFPAQIVVEYTFLPLKIDPFENTLHLILPNPLAQETLDQIKAYSHAEHLAIGISTPSSIVNAIQIHYRGELSSNTRQQTQEAPTTSRAESSNFWIAPPKMELRSCPACNHHNPVGVEHCEQCCSPMDLTQADPLIGKMAGRFRLKSKLGEGGMGLVYSAHHVDANQEAAVKILRTHLSTNERVVRRFHREAKAQNQLRHANIVYVHDFGFEEGIGFYLAMEFLKGQSLEDVLADSPDWLNLQSIHSTFQQVCDAMGFAHSRGIFHRDLKPDNIFILGYPEDGYDRQLKILDFGVAKMVESEEDQRLTRTGMTIGTPLYMAPEQAGEGNTDHRSDIYSIGVILFEVLTGKSPFEGSSAYQIMLRHVYADPPTLSETRSDLPYPQSLEDLLVKTLAKDPQDRPASMDLFWQHLDHSLREFSTLLSGEYPLHAGTGIRQPQVPTIGAESEDAAPLIVGRMVRKDTPEPVTQRVTTLSQDKTSSANSSLLINDENSIYKAAPTTPNPIAIHLPKGATETEEDWHLYKPKPKPKVPSFEANENQQGLISPKIRSSKKRASLQPRRQIQARALRQSSPEPKSTNSFLILLFVFILLGAFAVWFLGLQP